MLAAALLAALAAAPRVGLAEAFPASRRMAGPSGLALVHASGFSAPGLGATPAAAARAFLARHGASFGLHPGETLAVVRTPPPGTVGAVQLERRLEELPVFGGRITVGIGEAGEVFLVNASEVPPPAAARFAVGERAAREAARAVGRGTRAGREVAARGWLPWVSETRPVWRVDLASPAGDWRVFVDAGTGRVLWSVDRRRSAVAPGRVFEISPSETPAGPCPLETSPPFAGAHSECASPVPVELADLTSTQSLLGSRTAGRNCRGADAGAIGPAACPLVAAAAGGFLFDPSSPATFDTADDFAAVMAYHHAGLQLSFLRSLDRLAQRPAVFLPAYVNVLDAGGPFPNAFFSPGLSPAESLVAFGQALGVDFAYDASVVYHEVTHAEVESWGGLDAWVDSRGFLMDPLSANEGTADALAVAHTLDPKVGRYVMRCANRTACRPLPWLRDLTEMHTCRGTGAPGQDFAWGTGSIDGMNGEPHDDGEIWGDFAWAMQEGLAGLRGCGGRCDGAAQIQYMALEMAAGGAPTLAQYAQTAVGAAMQVFKSDPGVGKYVDCLAKRHELPSCDRTVPVYAGETKVLLVPGMYTAAQPTFRVEGVGATLRVCSKNLLDGVPLRVAPKVYLRRILPVTLTRLGEPPATPGGPFVPTEGAWDQEAQIPASGCADVALSASGVWYLLFDEPEAIPGFADYDLVSATAVSGVAARPPATAPAACAYVPERPTLPPASGNAADNGGCGQAASGAAPLALAFLALLARRRRR